MTTVTKKRTPNKSKGLGDTIAKVTKATGIESLVKFVAGEDCGCDQRKEKLNKIFPYGKQPKQCMSEEDYLKWGNFRESSGNTLTKEEADLVAITWNKLFARSKFYRPCTCNPREWQRMIDDLNHIYDSYAHN